MYEKPASGNQADREIESMLEWVIGVRRSVIDRRIRHLLDELEVDLRALIDQQYAGWLGIVVEDLALK